jgi:hypothetical protein
LLSVLLHEKNCGSFHANMIIGLDDAMFGPTVLATVLDIRIILVFS